MNTGDPVEQVVVDFGSHIGWYSTIAAAYGYEVAAVDVNAENCDLAEENLARATSAQFGVFCGTVQESSPALDVLPIRCVKIDIEGSEEWAIKMLDASIAAKTIDTLLIEISPVFNSFVSVDRSEPCRVRLCAASDPARRSPGDVAAAVHTEPVSHYRSGQVLRWARPGRRAVCERGPEMIKGFSCWECGQTWGATTVPGLFVVVVVGNDDTCLHRPSLHAVPVHDPALASVLAEATLMRIDWFNLHADTVTHPGMWDDTFLRELLDGVHGPVPDFGTVVVIPGRYHVDDLNAVNEHLAQYVGVLVIVTADEASEFPADQACA